MYGWASENKVNMFNEYNGNSDISVLESILTFLD